MICSGWLCGPELQKSTPMPMPAALIASGARSLSNVGCDHLGVQGLLVGVIFWVVGAQCVSSSHRSRTCPEQLLLRRSLRLEQVVRGGHQRPFPIHLLQTSQPEAIQASGALDLAEYGLHNRFA